MFTFGSRIDTSDLAGRVVAITGAGSGIGRELALPCARRGANLALCDINDAAVADTAQTARRFGRDVITRRVEVSELERMTTFTDATFAHFGGWTSWSTTPAWASSAGTLALCNMADIVVVKVKPGSRKGPLVEVGSGGELTIYVREPALDGKANDAVVRLLAAHLRLPRSRVELASGATSRLKRFRISR